MPGVCLETHIPTAASTCSAVYTCSCPQPLAAAHFFQLQVLKAQSAPDIIVVKRVSDAKVQVGQDVTFTIQVTHQAGLSDTIAENVVVTDTLPAGLKPYTDRWSVTPDVGADGGL